VHRYGEDAGNNARALTGTAKNVGVVYIDMRGIGRRALIKKVGKEYVSSKIRTSK
jgi:spartin